MPGPTAEVLNDDLKELKSDVPQVEVRLTTEIHAVDTKVEKLSTKFGVVEGGIKILAVLTLTSLAGSIWWGASLTVKFDSLKERFDKFEAKVDTRFDKLEGSMNRLGAGMAKLIDQTKPASKP